ncbi:DUF3846 domain-containing protein [Microbacterium sp. ASV81]|uniref:DUF3846 domain-containing protein n=1 Tax=Microbacterium capsulatum TaxID=3041921 RepID=A0ABU0XHZ8_9MICO|nr:DUF3846 domain-containing protein [Microbacterium sp. ASV81]MDQ4214749.1 DUF3846 domain-containing protein [Microbacterium sp. ASV81]
MVRCIVIPRDGNGTPRIQELDGIRDFQKVTGGWLEPIDLPALAVTIWVNEASERDRSRFNSRATALWWFYSTRMHRQRFILGDVVLTGDDNGEVGAEVPDDIIQGMLTPHEFVIQVSLEGDELWRNTPVCFDNIFDAIQWCMLVASTVRPGPGFRITSTV